ncbi:MAG: SCP2 sterol-binding domain-containing protein [Promethearchaeota archaeon]
MVDEELKAKISEKIEEGTLTPEDIPEYLELLVQVCNENEEVLEEVEGWNRIIKCKIEDADNIWLRIENKKFSAGVGDIKGEDADVTMEFDADIAIGIFSGEIDTTSAYMDNSLKVIGPLPDALKFKTLTEIVREEIED